MNACWEFIKEDLLEAVHDFFNGTELPVGISATSLALIPKVNNPSSWSDYRPISLCNFSHKIISKLLNDRLVVVLPNIISDNQSGFLKGRLISNNVLLTQELIHYLDVKTRNSNLVMKLDMLKAYDRLSWCFLEKMLRAFGFSHTWCDLILRTIKNCHYGVIVNGSSSGIIKVHHGLR